MTGDQGEFELTPQQRAAIESREPDILLEAGAGSGKTTTTVDRYMGMLCKGTDPRAILVFTFTDKAATELREKVRERRASSDEGDFSMSSAWVGTFHAICLRILQSHALAAEVDPGFKVLDDVNAETVKARAFNRSLIEFLSDDAHENTLGLFKEGPLRDSITDVFEELRSRGEIEPKLPAFEPTDPSKALDRLLKELRSALGEGKLKPAAAEPLTELLGYLDGRTAAEVTSRELEARRLTSKAKAVLGCHDACAEALSAFVARDRGDTVLDHLSELLAIYGRRYAEAKLEMSMLDYEDLQLITVKLLEDHPRIAETYETRFDEIMVDEFQDTNPLQKKLIDLLRGEETRLFTVGDEMQSIYGFRHADVGLFRERRRETPEKGRLKLSANFRSQPAIIGAVNEIGRQLDDQAKSAHNASPKDRQKFNPLLVGLPDQGLDSKVELRLTKDKGWRPFELGPLSPAVLPEDHGGDDEVGHYEAEALALAHRIRQLTDEGEYSQGEIVVLLRAKTRIELYRSALEQAGLSPYIVGGTGFWDSREATDVRSLLRVLANPLDDEALISALTSPASGVSSDGLWMLRRAAGSDQPLWSALSRLETAEAESGQEPLWLTRLSRKDSELLVEFRQRVRQLRTGAPVAPLAVTIERAVTATGYDLATLARNPDGTGLANIRRVMTLAQEFQASNGSDLREFLNWIELSAALDSESAAASVDEDSDVVRLMTIHKAKGLEFELVCLPDLRRPNRMNQDGSLIIGKPATGSSTTGPPGADFPVGLRLPNLGGPGYKLYGWEKLTALQKSAEADEELRLFHVALTRAKRGLLLSGLTSGNVPKVTESTAISNRLLQALEIDPKSDQAQAAVIPAPERAVPGHSQEPALEPTEIPVRINVPGPDISAELGQKFERVARADAGTPARPPLKRPGNVLYPDVPLSFTALSEYMECPAHFFSKRVLKLEETDDYEPLDPERSGPNRREGATSFGLAVHDLLETAATRSWAAPTREEVDSALEARGVDPATGESGDKAFSMISRYLKTDLAIRIAEGDATAEVALLARIGGVTIRGFADLIVADQIPLVVDYKTNRLDEISPEEKMDDYRLQRDLYALAVSRSRDGSGVETAFVYLNKPDDPVVFEYSSEDVDAAGDRIAAIVEEIKAGRFFGGPDATYQPCGSCASCMRLSSRLPVAG